MSAKGIKNLRSYCYLNLMTDNHDVQHDVYMTLKHIAKAKPQKSERNCATTVISNVLSLGKHFVF